VWLQQLEEAEMLPFLNEEQVRAEIRMVDLIPAMRTALIESSARRVSQPARQMLSVEPHGGYFGTMPTVGWLANAGLRPP